MTGPRIVADKPSQESTTPKHAPSVERALIKFWSGLNVCRQLEGRTTAALVRFALDHKRSDAFLELVVAGLTPDHPLLASWVTHDEFAALLEQCVGSELISTVDSLVEWHVLFPVSVH